MPFGVSRRDAPPWEGLLRGLGVIFVFMVVIWLFWEHNARTLEMIESQRSASQQVVSDETRVLTDEQKQAIYDLSRALQANYGLELRVIVDVKPVIAPEMDAGTIFIGMYPEGRQAVVILPPLVERAVGVGLANHLRRHHFPPYWQSGDWPRGLGEALGLIWDALSAPGGQNVPLNGPVYRGRVQGEGQG